MRHDTQRCNGTLQLLPRIQRKRPWEIRVQTNFLVTTPDFHLIIFVSFGNTFRIALWRILLGFAQGKTQLTFNCILFISVCITILKVQTCTIR